MDDDVLQILQAVCFFPFHLLRSYTQWSPRPSRGFLLSQANDAEMGVEAARDTSRRLCSCSRRILVVVARTESVPRWCPHRLIPRWAFQSPSASLRTELPGSRSRSRLAWSILVELCQFTRPTVQRAARDGPREHGPRGARGKHGHDERRWKLRFGGQI
jgi:hypothetical protein